MKNHELRERWQPDIYHPPNVYAFVADGGATAMGAGYATNQSAVANRIKTWNPELIIFGGDNNYPSGAVATLATNWQYWADEIAAEIVFPAMGNHDLDTSVGQPQLDYFGYLPGNGRYYWVDHGNTRWWMLNSGYNSALTLVEPDGNDEESDQAEWFRRERARSRQHWNFVVFHHPPYTSVDVYDPGYAAMRWNWKGLGVDAVLCGHGHAYERLSVDGLPVLIAGTGGGDLYGFATTPSAYSQTRYNALHGALKLEVQHDLALFKFYDKNGVKIDQLSLRKGAYDDVGH